MRDDGLVKPFPWADANGNEHMNPQTIAVELGVELPMSHRRELVRKRMFK